MYAKLVLDDLITNVRESGTLSTVEIDLALLELELDVDDATGFSFLFKTEFKFQRNVQS